MSMSDLATASLRLTRRRALGLGLGVGGAALLGACSSPGDDEPAAQSTALREDTGTITVLTWETYHDQPWLDEYASSTGVRVEAIAAGSGDEMFARAQSGSVRADIFYFDSGLIQRFVQAELIAPVAADRLTNVGVITPGMDWRQKNTYKGQLYGIPYNWGTQPLMYDASVITTPPDSWAALWDPQYRGKVVLFDAADVTIPMIALYVGAQDAYNLTDEEFDKVRAALRDLRPQVRAVAKGFDDAVNIFAAGDGVIGYCQNISEVTQLNSNGRNFGYTFPKEGTPQWLDNAILSPDGQRQEVYDFIDATLTPQWQARFIQASTNNGILSAAGAREAKVPEETLKKTNILDQEDPAFWQKMRGMVAPESVSRRLEIWNEFKAGT
jgi:spermidine/putrescine transport system substrate-binding protein